MFIEQDLNDQMQKGRHNVNCYDSRGSLDEMSQMHHPGGLTGPVGPTIGPGVPFNALGPASIRHHAPFIAMSSSEMDDQECKVINEFCHLLEKSKQLFNGLRDLPQYGHKQWQPYFGRTFDVYTKLWKFQQQHRPVLDARYGLKRWQIGEIASKIGQLYYHYYLRTSETNYLNEAYAFYSSIRSRGYYSKATKEERPDLMVKKLRYYARFIVVCLLLKKMKLVRDLVRELAKHIDDYSATYEPDDQREWSMVLAEIKSFLEAYSILTVVDLDNVAMVMSHRLSAVNTPPYEKVAITHYSLAEIIIVGNVCDQVKFSELTLDMFRMLQVLEREPLDYTNQMYGSSPSAGRSMGAFENGSGDRSGHSYKRDNPHKYLLYRPSFSQLFVFLASGFKELPANSVLLLYLSADGLFGNVKHPEDYGYDFGGVLTNPRLREGTDTSSKSNSRASVGQVKEANCLYPGDLYSFTRKPFFLIVDSDNSSAFQHIPRYFGQPFLVLMSPEEAPPPFHDQQHKGSLFTLFLHCPLTAICLISNIIEVPIQLWEKAQQHVDHFLSEAGRLLVHSRSLDPVFLHFYGDDFLRVLILRFIFCCMVSRMHRLFRVSILCINFT